MQVRWYLYIYVICNYLNVSVLVDSFGPRGVTNICNPGQFHIVSPYRRAKDAHGAKIYLEGLPFVDSNRIAVMGWSHGGETTLHAVQINVPSSSPFQAAVALYPYCIRLYILNSPLLVLIGEKDDWTPANECKFHLKPKEGWPEIILKVYPDAYHAFDATHGIGFYMGHVTGRNQSAAEDSYKMVKAFLEKYLVD
jgi:dienelactone hydrolase